MAAPSPHKILRPLGEMYSKLHLRRAVVVHLPQTVLLAGLHYSVGYFRFVWSVRHREVSVFAVVGGVLVFGHGEVLDLLKVRQHVLEGPANKASGHT